MQSITRRRAGGLLAAATLWPAQRAMAADYPTRPVTLMHGFAPGGTADVISRLLAPALGEELGQSIVVESRPGAGGNIASAALTRANPDGHVIGLLTGGHAVSAAFGQNLNHEPVEGFEFVAQLVRYAFVIAVRADSPMKGLPDLLRTARAGSGAVQFGSAGTGSTHHLVGEALNAMAGLEMTPVPYRGDAAGITALLAGEVPVMVTTAVSAIPFAREERIRCLCVTGPRRSTRLPEVPTVMEAGLPGFDITTWAGIAAPRATPAPVVARLNQALGKMLARPALRARLEETVDGEATIGTPAEMRTMIVAEIARWQELIRRQHISIG